MEIFYEQLVSLLLLGILLFFSFRIYRFVVSYLEKIAVGGTEAPAGKSVRRDVRINRYGEILTAEEKHVVPANGTEGYSRKAESAPRVCRGSIGAFFRRLPSRLPQLKDAIGAFFRQFPGHIRENNRVMGQLLRNSFQESTLVRLIPDVVMVAVISLLMAFYCNSKQGGLDLYMTTYIPMIGVLMVIFWFTELVRGSRTLAFASGVMILTGITLQVLLKLPAEDAAAASELVIFAVLSVAVALVAVPLIRLVTTGSWKNSMIIFLNLVVIGLYLVLLVFGKTVNSTRAWLIVGGMSFQLTEVTKTISCAIMAMQFTNPDVKVKGEATPEKIGNSRLLSAAVTLVINALFLLVINEFGSLVVLALVFFVLALVFLPSIKRLMLLVGMCVCAMALVLMVCFMCYNIKYSAVPAEETTAGQETTAAVQTEDPEQSGDTSQAEETKLNPVVELGAKIYKKFALRVALVLDPDSVDPNGGGYQTRRALEALMLSGWFGSAYEVSIPVVSSDFIFAYLVMKMGVVFGVLLIVLLLCMLINGTMRCLGCADMSEGAVGLAFILSMTLQSLLAAASATGQFIMIGVPFAFLAEGGSATMMNYAMLLYAIYATRQGASAPRMLRPVRSNRTDEPKKPAVLRRKEQDNA